MAGSRAIDSVLGIFMVAEGRFLLRGFLPLLLALSLSACAIPQQMDLIEREQSRLRAENASVRSEVDGMRSTLADTRANLQQIQGDLDAVKGKVDEVGHQLDRQIGQSSREGSQRLQELEGRIAKIEEALKAQAAELQAREAQPQQAGAAPGAESGAGSSSASGEFVREKPPAESEAVKKDYDEAWTLLDKKDYRGAIARFKDFLKKHPESAYADNAQYWIGECYYALREFDQAILEFDTVRRKYPKGDKVPAALLKQGYAFAELGDKVDARLILQELVDRYPQSQEAPKAKQKLKSLES